MRGPVVILMAVACVAGCRSQQTAPSDPFLPFMRTRVPPPGTAQPPVATPGEPYYPSGAAPPGGTAPAFTPPGASAPSYSPATPVAPPMSAAPQILPSSPGAAPPIAPLPNDKYSPRGGFNLPQGSLDRPKVVDPEKQDRGTPTIATRRLKSTDGSQSEVETELTAAHSVAGAKAIETDESSTSAKVAADENDDTGGDTDPVAATTRLEVRGGEKLARDESESDDGPANVIRIVTPKSGGELAAAADTFANSADDPAPSARLQLTVSEPIAQVASRAADSYGAQQASYSVPQEKSPLSFRSISDGTASAVTAAVYQQPTPASATPAPAAEVASLSDTPGKPYSHDASYRGLQGRLEYSESAKQWKLRYIPIDGQTDSYGGSVLLGASPMLEGYKPGDFVSVQGAVASSSGSRGFSPAYQLERVEPLGR